MSPWAPLFDETEQHEIRAALDRIARALNPSTSSWPERLDTSLGGGSAGMVLFYAYLHLDDPEKGFDRSMEPWLDHVLNATPEPPSLYGGFAGTAWMLAHLQGRTFDLEGDAWSEDVDEALLRELQSGDRTLNWDLVKGLAGSGVYWLERLPRSSAQVGLASLIDHLQRIAETPDGHVTWRCPREALFFSADRELYADGIYNLTVSHGTTGILGLLAGALAAEVDPGMSRRLLDGGLRWLLDHEEPAGSPSAFPMSYTPDDPDRGRGQDVRLAWCRGDAGIAATLMAIAQTLGEPEVGMVAVRVAARSALRRERQAAAADPGLCHGTAGLAHLFNRMYQRTGDPALAEAARFWYRRTLGLLRPDLPETGGCWSWQHRHGTWGDHVQREEPAFLLGAAGVGLSLLAAVSNVEPAWDRLLMASFATEPRD